MLLEKCQECIKFALIFRSLSSCCWRDKSAFKGHQCNDILIYGDNINFSLVSQSVENSQRYEIWRPQDQEDRVKFYFLTFTFCRYARNVLRLRDSVEPDGGKKSLRFASPDVNARRYETAHIRHFM